MESDIKWEGIDYCEAEECNKSRLRRTQGTAKKKMEDWEQAMCERSGATGAGERRYRTVGIPRGHYTDWPEEEDDCSHSYKDRVEKMMNTHIYTFGDKFYLQKKLPIGLWSTCAAARVVMSAWDVKWQQRVKDVNICLEDALRYMDDSQATLHPIKAGWRWWKDDLMYCNV
jgi:hypothetical protein